jgi:hypothetical protein
VLRLFILVLNVKQLPLNTTIQKELLLPKQQKSRKTKVSQGSAIGSKPVPLTTVQKVLLGGGLAHVTKPKKKK